ncbi:hypothetical protein H5410_014628 [Solanum commersonii]|uniref:Uncharacterized protein n=1 Tax=Solanum commersonii TaxID=4109 RepID=A0A9J5ZRZ0_SOLCO|nr:hypothetical protein H5410_014628 [Solanum commersonii]
MSEMLPSEQHQESKVWSPISSFPHDHFINDIKNEESIISKSTKEVVDEIEDQKATKKGKLLAFDLYEMKCVCPKHGEKRKSPKPEFYVLKPIAILKSMYHYFFNYGVIPYPNYLENFINYIEASIPNLKFRGYDIHREIFDLSMD